MLVGGNCSLRTTVPKDLGSAAADITCQHQASCSVHGNKVHNTRLKKHCVLIFQALHMYESQAATR